MATAPSGSSSKRCSTASESLVDVCYDGPMAMPVAIDRPQLQQLPLLMRRRPSIVLGVVIIVVVAASVAVRRRSSRLSVAAAVVDSWLDAADRSHKERSRHHRTSTVSFNNFVWYIIYRLPLFVYEPISYYMLDWQFFIFASL